MKRVRLAASAALVLTIGAAGSAAGEDSDVFCGTEVPTTAAGASS